MGVGRGFSDAHQAAAQSPVPEYASLFSTPPWGGEGEAGPRRQAVGKGSLHPQSCIWCLFS